MSDAETLTHAAGILFPLVFVEGLDGSGKDTQADRLCARLEISKRSFPRYETPVGHLIRRMLRQEAWVSLRGLSGSEEETQKASALVLQALMTYDKRSDPNLSIAAGSTWDSGPTVYVRGPDSAVIYGTSDGLNYEELLRVHEGLRQPYRSLLLRVSVETAIARMRARGGPPERYENEPALRRVMEGYDHHWKAMSPDPAYRIVNAEGTPDEVEAHVWEALIT